MAKLHFYNASVDAGNSTILLQADVKFHQRGMATMHWTGALDDRGDGRAIESRIGPGADAHRFAPGTGLWARAMAVREVEPLACTLIDEALGQ